MFRFLNRLFLSSLVYLFKVVAGLVGFALLLVVTVAPFVFLMFANVSDPFFILRLLSLTVWPIFLAKMVFVVIAAIDQKSFQRDHRVVVGAPASADFFLSTGGTVYSPKKRRISMRPYTMAHFKKFGSENVYDIDSTKGR